MNALEPKLQFQKLPAAKVHADLVVSDPFKTALQSALAQQLYEEGSPSSPDEAAASWHRIAGAKTFIHVLLNLAEVPQQRKPDTTQNLHHIG